MSHGRGKKQGQERSPLSLSPFPVILCFPPTLIVFFTLFLTWTLINHSWAPAPAQVPAVPCPHRVPVTSLHSGTRQGCSQDLAPLLPSPSPPKSCCLPSLGWAVPADPGPLGDGGHNVPRASVASLEEGTAAQGGCPGSCSAHLEMLWWEGRVWGPEGCGSRSWNRVGERKEEQLAPPRFSPDTEDASERRGN